MMETPTLVLDKSTALLERIIHDNGQIPIREQAASLGLPISTTYRFLSRYVEKGWVCQTERGRYILGLALAQLVESTPRNKILASVARPVLRRYSKRLSKTFHFGVLERDMVTYLVKAGEDHIAHFTRENMQLEAYCSGIGKVLLAHLPQSDLDRYLNTGPFVKLTQNTLTDPEQIREALRDVRMQDYALDEQEVSENLQCIAVPVRDGNGTVLAAVSMSRESSANETPGNAKGLQTLRSCSAQIEKYLCPS